jgi:hypothetical protein
MRLLALALVVAAPAFSQPAPAEKPAATTDKPATSSDKPAATENPAAVEKPAAAEKPAASGAEWQAKFDELWKKRDAPGIIEELHAILSTQLAADPRSFDANWRLASLYNWEANQTEGDKKAELGHKAWEAGDVAIAARADDVHGQYQAGAGIGLYSEGVGILTALSQGLEGKFRDRLQASLKLDKDYLDGSPQMVWGRYFFKLPWPKRDVDESIRVLTACVESHPHNLRAKLYLADSLANEGSMQDAKKLIKEIMDAQPADDPPEQRLVKSLAQKWMASH